MSWGDQSTGGGDVAVVDAKISLPDTKRAAKLALTTGILHLVEYAVCTALRETEMRVHARCREIE